MQWARALRISAIREFRFHDLRHTFASRLAQRGVSIKADRLAMRATGPTTRPTLSFNQLRTHSLDMLFSRL
jgi:integrase